jgi:hypothetical protein
MMLQRVKQDPKQPATKPMPDERARPQKLRLETLEQRLAPACDMFMKIK